MTESDDATKAQKLAMLESKDELLARAEQVRSEKRAYRDSVDTENTFCTVDLGDWVDLCRKAGVPYIDAEPVAEVGVEDITSFDEPCLRRDRLKPFGQAIRRIQESGEPEKMLRWSCCAGAEIKHQLGKGRHEWRPEFLSDFQIDDLRAFDLIAEFPKPTIQAWLRPWERLLISDGYPIEFRVFVENDNIAGISSYYPKRPLPFTKVVVDSLSDIVDYTTKMINNQRKPLNCPELPSAAPHMDMSKNNWTADFAVNSRHDVLFLEGGPPYTGVFGAHPCCFAMGEIEGVALRPRRGVAGDVEAALEREQTGGQTE